ncbi:putative cold-shock DNA-binding protein [Ancylomarina subtilis]|uniref:Putative cold-shock DNA-binding protein n=1 Tax=Ancylomarina subtilis TaxID=1639035 RepID=A0A4V2FSX3_9BACT|nr:cold shock domain-containing protein [Ancylomarina subtilis]RZT95955.1 putative cold-shock DNA-binding protein [Ancylomarina subtilis]
MARSKETFGKKELEKKKLKKRKEKEARKEERKANGGSVSFEDMLVYVDENGQLVSTPPDPTKKTEIDADSIVLGARNSNAGYVEDPIRKGTVTFFNTSKGYGFIKDAETGESIFVHINGLVDQVNENDKVNFETERGPKGMNAVNVTLIKK